MNEDERKSVLPEKYHDLIKQGLSITRGKGKELSFFFIDYETYRQFLVLYEPDDFADYELIILFSGQCQGCQKDEFMGSHKFVLINSVRAKIAETLSRPMLVHLCEGCMSKVAGGVKLMIAELLFDFSKIQEDSSIPEDKKQVLLLGIADILRRYPQELALFTSKLDAAVAAQKLEEAETAQK